MSAEIRRTLRMLPPNSHQRLKNIPQFTTLTWLR